MSNNNETVVETAEKNPIEYIDPLTRLKQERALKKEKKKAVKTVADKFGGDKKSKKMATKLVKGAVQRIMRKNGRGG